MVQKNFVQTENTWKQIPKLIDDISNNEFTLEKANEDFNWTIIDVIPDYSSLDVFPNKIRVIFSAFLCKDGVPSEEIVSDYIDIDISK